MLAVNEVAPGAKLRIAGGLTAEVLDPEYIQSMRLYLESGRQEEFVDGFSLFSNYLRSVKGKRIVRTESLWFRCR